MKTVAIPKRSHWKAMAEASEPRLQPPEGMNDAQKKVWTLTVSNLPPDWFTAEQAPTLAQYCNHVCRAAQLEKAIEQLDPIADLETFDKISKLICGESAKIAMFARSMRLTAQSRMKPDTAATRGAAAAGVASISSAGKYFNDAGLIPGLQ